MSRQKKVFAILVILVLLCTWVFPACADPEALPEENEEIVAGDVLSDTDDPEETLIAASGEETEEEKDGEILQAVVSDGEKEEKEEEEQPNLVTEEEQEAEEEKKEEKEEELPGEFGENIDLEEGFSEPVDSSDKSEPSEEQYQPEEKDDQEKEDDDIEFDPEEGDGKPAEDGQEDEQIDGQDETVSTKLEEKQEEPAPAMAMLSLSKRGDIAVDQQEKTEEPPPEESVLRNTKGNTEYYTVVVHAENIMSKICSDYQVLASVGGASCIGTIQSTGAVYFGADLQLPGKPESLAIVSKGNYNETLHEITINNKSYFIYDPVVDEEKHECTIKVVQQTQCQIVFSSVPGTDMTGRYYIVVKRKGYGTPVAWAQIENGKMGSVQSRNNNAIYNDSTFVIIKTDDFDIDRYSSYPEKILQSGGQFSNSIIFTWNSTPILENKTYFYYINARQVIDITIEERTEYGEITISTKGSDEQELSETTFALYEEACPKAIRTFTGGSITVRTKEDLGDYLPAETGADHARTLYLKQTEAQAGYDIDETTHRVVITKTITEQLDETENKKTITTSYEITVDEANATNIVNQKRTGPDEREDGKINIAVVDQNGAPLTGSTIILYSDQLCTEKNQIAAYTAQSFEISTEGTTLESCLPTETGASHAITLYLVETEAPAGYDKDITIHTVVITKSIDVYLNGVTNSFITKTIYRIEIDGVNAANIENEKRTGPDDREDRSVEVTVTDSNGAELSGTTCNLYAEDSCKTEIKKYPGGSFTISTADTSLENYLPKGTEPNTSVTLYLKETAAQAGYNVNTIVHPIVITKNVAENLNTETNEFIVTTTYGITIDEANAVNIVNQKRMGEEDRKDGSVAVTVTDSDGAELNGSTCELFAEESSTNPIKTYTGGSITISTADTSLENYLPKGTEPNTSVTLYLKETVAQTGYEADITVYPVVITKSVAENLNTETNEFIITTTYGITISGKNSVTIKNTKNTDTKCVNGNVEVIVTDSDGAELNGSICNLYAEDSCKTEIKKYPGGSFTISTADTLLEKYLPKGTDPDISVTLYLKETTAQAGYEADITVYPVVITKNVSENLDTSINVFITTTTYGITIDGKNFVTIKNTKNTDTKREDGSIAIENKDSDGAALSGSTFKLYSNQECSKESELVAYTDHSFVISTSDEALKNSLPAATGTENASTLYLKQETAPMDYDMDTELHSVVITKDVETTYLDTETNMYITKTVYGITIDGEREIVITNKRHSVTNGEGNNMNSQGQSNPTGEGNGDSTTTEGNGNTTTGGEGNGTTAGGNWNNTTGEGNGDSTTTEGNGNTTTGGEGNGTTAGGNWNNTTGEGNGGSTITEGNGNVTSGGDDDGTKTGDNGKNVTGEVNGKSATSGETVNNATGGKDGNSKNSSENGDETVVRNSGSISTRKNNGDNLISKPNQEEKASGTAEINTSTGSITTGNDGATKQTEQGITVASNVNSETKSLTTKTEPCIQKHKTNRGEVSDEQNEDISIYGAEIEQVISFIQETIRIITRIGELLSALVRTNIFTFLK